MKKCEVAMKKVIESDPNMGAFDQAIDEREYNRRVREAVDRARKNGRYAKPETRELLVIDKASKLVGKTIPMESYEGNKFVDVKVKSAEMVAADMVSINDGEYVLDLKSGTTRDGQYMLGSEDGMAGDGIAFFELNGTVTQNLQDYVKEAVRVDGDKLSDTHREYLQGIVDMYSKVLELAGKDVSIDAKFLKLVNEAENTRGTADPKLGKIRLYLGNQSNNTMTEILAHELQHVMIRHALESDKQLAYNVLKLRDLMRKEFEAKYGNGNGWKVFTEGKANPDENDARKKWDYVFNSKEFPADEFLAYATTNEQLVNAMSGIRTVQNMELLGKFKEKKDKNGNVVPLNKWKRLWNKIADTINKVYTVNKMQGKNAQQLAVDMLDVALRQGYKAEEIARKSKMDKVLDGISKLDERIARYTGAIDKEYKSYDEFIRSEEEDKLQRAVNSIWKIRGLAKARSWALQNNVFNSVTRDVKNADIAKFYEMFRKSKAFVEKEVVAVKNKTAKVLEEDFGLNKLADTERRAVKRVLLDVDAKSLGDIAEVRRYLDDSKLVDDEIDKINDELNNSDVLYAADELANLLVHNKMGMRNGYVNASQIALGEMGSRAEADISKIDKLVTLLAIRKLDGRVKSEAVKGIDKEVAGLDKAMRLFKLSEKEVLDKAYAGDKMYQVKGAKQENYKSDKKHYLVDEKEMKELVKAGMTNTGMHKKLSGIMKKDMYVVIGDSIDVTYTEGLMSVIQLKNEGDSLKHVLMDKMEMTEEEAEDEIDRLVNESGVDDEALIPERSGTGDIYDYKIRLSYETKADLMDMDDDIVTTIAGSVSNLTHKQEAMVNNRASLIYLNNFYNDYKTSKKFKFVEISKDSEGKYKEYWDMMPYYMKKAIEQRYNGKLMIEESLLVDYFGYKDVSVVNAPWVKQRVKRQVVAKKLESIVKEVTKRWKKVIVAFTFGTIKGNMLSNMIVAMQHTSYKDPIKYVKKFGEVWEMMNKYQEDRSKKIELEIRRDAGEAVSQREIDGLEASMRENPVHVIIEDGQYNAILEDINTEYFDNKGIVERKIDETLAKIKKDKSREALKTLIDTLYIRKDSFMHDSVMKMTTYSDAVNKMIILLDQMETTGGKVDQKTLNYVDSLHVNYGYLDNRYIKYANDLGFLAFTKYFFRVFPAMMKLLSNKAMTVMLTEGGRKLTGLGETPFEPFYSPIDSMVRKVSLWGSPTDVLGDILVPTIVK